MKYAPIALAALAVLATNAHAAPPMMSTEWTAQACDAWNKDAALTNGLADKWIKNDKGRGYKI
ncbi:MAG TPA: sterol-binding protein, partial [Thiobacillaceae bacterium]